MPAPQNLHKIPSPQRLFGTPLEISLKKSRQNRPPYIENASATKIALNSLGADGI
jgi:hypothetical protein